MAERRQYSDEPKAEALKQQSMPYQGPITPPELLRQYDEIVPGAADRILEMAEEQSKHRQSCERMPYKQMLGEAFHL